MSEELSSQADKLLDLMRFFNIGDVHSERIQSLKEKVRGTAVSPVPTAMEDGTLPAPSSDQSFEPVFAESGDDAFEEF